ncbi:MAG: type 4a pilus biogenesis protein PilO [Candidatus Omnitrophica bacterium]|nr:type 4a pilus biogenesis protein PilO [Candidatus Omnitrophota bacterium]
MIKLSKRELVIFILCLTLTIGFVVFKFVMTPLREHGGDVEDNIALAERRLEKSQQILRSETMVDAQYQKLVDVLGVFESEGAEFSDIVSRLEALAKEAGIHVVNVQPQAAMNKEDIRSFPVQLDIDGQWSAIARFLYVVQAQTNRFNVDEFNLEKYSDTGGSLRGRIILSRIRMVAAK